MKPRALLTVAALAAIVASGCATSSAVKNASRVQIEALVQARQSVGAYVALSDKEIRKIEEVRETERDLMRMYATVLEVAGDDEPDPNVASGNLTTKLLEIRREPPGPEADLAGLRRSVAENMGYLVSLLGLLQRSQELINEYLITDVGPTTEQVTSLSQELQGLLAAVGGEGGS